LKLINITGAAIVLLSNIYVSFNHSIELFRQGGFSGNLAYVGVIGAEVTFLMGALNMVVSKLKGENAELPAKLGFILGVSLILWSNIHAGLGAGITGIILGAVTPVSLIIAEMIIGRAIVQKTEEHSRSVTVVEEAKDSLMETALQLYRTNGKIPSRRSFMDIANISEWQARKTIETLKESIGGGK
jgi:hypothetical protein